MARKKAELTPEQKLQAERERCLKEASEQAQHLREPSYFFSVGDHVTYGMLIDPVVEEVLEGGKIYLLRCTTRDNNYGHPIEYETYRAAKWMEVRPVGSCGTSEFYKQNTLERLSFNNTTIDSLLFYFYNFGIDMNPDYQRGFVWSDEDKEKLLDSVFCGIDIGKFVLVTKDNWLEDNVYYEILDGKQRLAALMDFYEDKITYRGHTFTQLSAKDRACFCNRIVSVAIAKDISRDAILRYFLALNRGGRVMDPEQIKKVEEMLEKEKC